MGAPKPLLEWLGVSLIEWQICQLRDAGAAQVVVVVGHAADDVRPLVERAGAKIIVNERYREGRASSLRAGAAAVSGDIDAVVVLGVDQPRPAAVVRRLIAEHRNGVTVPVYNGRRGHPAVVDGALLPELRAVDDATKGLRAVVERHPVHELSFDSVIVLLDVNTPEDYEEARTMFSREVPS
jgi:CTP:molybdopterin cytidylyltransferase MocA